MIRKAAYAVTELRSYLRHLLFDLIVAILELIVNDFTEIVLLLGYTHVTLCL